MEKWETRSWNLWKCHFASGLFYGDSWGPMRGLCPRSGYRFFILSVSFSTIYLGWPQSQQSTEQIFLASHRFLEAAQLPSRSQATWTLLVKPSWGAAWEQSGGGLGWQVGFTLTPFLRAVLPPPPGLLSDVPKAFPCGESGRTEWCGPIKKWHPLIRSPRQPLV